MRMLNCRSIAILYYKCLIDWYFSMKTGIPPPFRPEWATRCRSVDYGRVKTESVYSIETKRVMGVPEMKKAPFGALGRSFQCHTEYHKPVEKSRVVWCSDGRLLSRRVNS